MTHADDSDLIGLKRVAELLPAAIPKPVEVRFLQVATQLVGSALAIPAAYLKSVAQGIEDRAAIRTILVQRLADPAFDILSQNSEAVALFVESVAPSAMKKALNRSKVTVAAARYLGSSGGTGEGADSAPEAESSLDEDWITKFVRHAEDATTDRMQDLFARALAGEIKQPGSFSPMTLRVMSEITPTIASDFQLEWDQTLSYFLPTEEFSGERLMRINRLKDAGFLNANEIVFKRTENEKNVFTFAATADVGIIISYSGPVQNTFGFNPDTIGALPLTIAGQQIGSLLPPRDMTKALRTIARVIPKEGVSKIELHVSGHVETIYSNRPLS